MMDQNTFGIFGAGGAARAVLPMLKDCRVVQDDLPDGSWETGKHKFCLIETSPHAAAVDEFVIHDEESFFQRATRSNPCCIVIGSSSDRRRVAERIGFAQRPTFSLFSSSSRVETALSIGKGAVICANAYVSVNVKIGLSFFMNLGAILEHDCEVGNFVTFSPGVVCCGNVQIDDDVFVGAGAVIINGTASEPLKIGRGSRIGAGAVVTRSVGPGQTVVGNPARLV